MASKGETPKILMLLGGVLTAIGALATLFVPTATVPTVDTEVVVAIGVVLLVIGAIL